GVGSRCLCTSGLPVSPLARILMQPIDHLERQRGMHWSPPNVKAQQPGGPDTTPCHEQSSWPPVCRSGLLGDGFYLNRLPTSLFFLCFSPNRLPTPLFDPFVFPPDPFVFPEWRGRFACHDLHSVKNGFSFRKLRLDSEENLL